MVIVGHPADINFLILGNLGGSNMDVWDTFAGKSAFNYSLDTPQNCL